METQTEKTTQGNELLKRQQGRMKCKICGKKLKRFPSNRILSGIIDGKMEMTLLTEYTGYDFIDMHRKCWEKDIKQRGKD